MIYLRKFLNRILTKHKSQGTWIGLYMAKMITEDALNVIDNKNCTCFEILLPWKN